MVSFMTRLLYLKEKSHRYVMDGGEAAWGEIKKK
jgi:hypothetical protein